MFYKFITLNPANFKIFPITHEIVCIFFFKLVCNVLRFISAINHSRLSPIWPSVVDSFVKAKNILFYDE